MAKAKKVKKKVVRNLSSLNRALISNKAAAKFHKMKGKY